MKLSRSVRLRILRRKRRKNRKLYIQKHKIYNSSKINKCQKKIKLFLRFLRMDLVNNSYTILRDNKSSNMIYPSM